MTFILFAVPNDAAQLSGGNSPAATPVTNLLTPQPAEAWRSDGLSDLYVVADFGAAVSLDTVALLFTNATDAATWRVRAATSEGNLTAAPGYDSGTGGLWASTEPAPLGAAHAFLHLVTAQTFRWWRIDITDAANPAGDFEAGRLVMARAWRPTRNESYGKETGYIDTGEETLTYGGNVIPRAGGLRPMARWRIQYLERAEMEDELMALNAVGEHRPVMVVFDPDRAEHRQGRIHYGLLKKETPIVNPVWKRFEQGFRIEGLI